MIFKLIGISILVMISGTVLYAQSQPIEDMIVSEIKSTISQQLPDAISEITPLTPLTPKELGLQSNCTINRVMVIQVLGNKYLGLARYKLSLITKNSQSIETTVMVSVKVFEKVLISTNSVTKKNRITQYEFALKDVTYLIGREIFFTDAQIIERYRASKYISKGEIITASDLEQIPIIKENQLVQVRAKYNGILAEYEGISKQEGNLQEIIEIQNPKSKAIFLAKIVNAQQVEVVL